VLIPGESGVFVLHNRGFQGEVNNKFIYDSKSFPSQNLIFFVCVKEVSYWPKPLVEDGPKRPHIAYNELSVCVRQILNIID